MTDETNQVQPENAAQPEIAESAPVTEAPESSPADPGITEAEKTAVQKRIDKLTWEKSERDREIAYWRSLAMQRQEPPQEPEKPKLDAPPTLEQYGHDEAKYQLAVTEYAKAVARAEAQEAIRAERERERAEGRSKTFKTREAEFAAKTEDYQAKVYDPTLPITREMVELIAESEIGPQLAYHLASNRDVAAQIAALPPILAARELGKIEAKLSQPKPAPVVSKAPPPPPKVEEGAETVTRISADSPESDKLDDKEWMRKRNKQVARKGG